MLKLLGDVERQVDQAQLQGPSGQQEPWSFEALQTGLEGTLLRSCDNREIEDSKITPFGGKHEMPPDVLNSFTSNKIFTLRDKELEM